MTQSHNCEDIKAFVMDIDGVLTDGRIGYGCGSDEEIKFFDVKDGTGIKMLQRSGIVTAIISGRQSAANKRRANELGIGHYIEKCVNKADGMRRLCQELGIETKQCLYVGDDFIDLAAMRLAGIGAAVADASQEVLDAADWRLNHRGGRGAVREAAELLLKAQGKWSKAIEKYYKD